MPKLNSPIKIIFYPGTHGHYVEFVLNTLATRNSNIKIGTYNPIDPGGTFHVATSNNFYVKNRFFKCYHPGPTDYHRMTIDPLQKINKDELFIKINFKDDEDVTVRQLVLTRGPEFCVDLESLTEDTYNKLKSIKSATALEIINNINQFSDIGSYANIKDPSWPDINSVADFWKLPDYIVNECTDTFGFAPFYLDQHNPNAPRWVLRALFKFWFYDDSPAKTPEFTACDSEYFANMYQLNLRDIYDVDLFKQQLLKIGNWAGMDFDLDYFSQVIHNDYVSKVPNKHSKQLCQDVFFAVKHNKNITINLNIIEESYVEYLCENYFNIKFSMLRNKFFNNTSELRKYIDNKI